MDLDKVLNLLAAVETALEFIDGQRDYITDTTSDFGMQVPNEACHVYSELLTAYQDADNEYDRAKEAKFEWERSAEYKRQRRMQAQEDMQ